MQPAQHAGQRRTGIDAEAGRNEGGVGLKTPGAVAQQPHHGQVNIAIGELRLGEQLKILAPDLDGLLIEPGVLVRQFLLGGDVAG